jgi:cytochrome c-type biogenesis protein CcmH/NrfG
MKAESIIFGIAGMVFGVLIGWMIGDRQARHAGPIPVTTAAAPATPQAGQQQAPPPLDETKVQALQTVAQNDVKNVNARVQLANLYFDSERFDDAIKWYEDAFKLDSKNVDVSTDLGVSYYYSNQPDRALKQFDHSLGLDPNHVKTLLNQGIVLAFGKRDLDGAAVSWQKVVDVAPPGSPEATAAQRALESLKAAHTANGTQAPGS